MSELYTIEHSVDDESVVFLIDQILNECDWKVREWYSDPKRIKRYQSAYIMYTKNMEPFSISFKNHYNGWDRIGQLHYTLKSFRKEYPSAMLRENGFLDTHYNDCDSKGIFFSIHLYNKRMITQSTMMNERLINTYGKKLTHLRNELLDLGVQQFHEVDQHFFVLPKKQNIQSFNRDDFFKDILK